MVTNVVYCNFPGWSRRNIQCWTLQHCFKSLTVFSAVDHWVRKYKKNRKHKSVSALFQSWSTQSFLSQRCSALGKNDMKTRRKLLLKCLRQYYKHPKNNASEYSRFRRTRCWWIPSKTCIERCFRVKQSCSSAANLWMFQSAGSPSFYLIWRVHSFRSCLFQLLCRQEKGLIIWVLFLFSRISIIWL